MHIKVNEEIIIQKLKEFQTITGQTANYIYSKFIHPFIMQVINLHIFNVPKLYREDAKQNVIILILRRLKRIDFDTIQIHNIRNYFFIMVKRLVLNELEKINRKKSREVMIDELSLTLLNDVFIYELTDD
jgi:DNA-directed RNA polymerase specialized sigma24 family protein